MSGEIEVTRHGMFRWGWRLRVDGEHFYGKGPTRRIARRRAGVKLGPLHPGDPCTGPVTENAHAR